MYKKLGLIVGFLGVLVISCEDNNISTSVSLNTLQRCIDSKGVFDFNKNVCVCGGTICDENQYCNNDLKCKKKECLKETEEKKEICKDGKIYQCVGVYYEFKETCAYGCNGDGTTCNINIECNDGNKKCIENENDAIILTCTDGFWPEVVNWNGDESEYIEIYENRRCHPSEPSPVDCLSNRCVPQDEWKSLACEDYKDIIMAHMKQLDELKKDSLNQINSWFGISFDSEIIKMAQDEPQDEPQDKELIQVDLCEFNQDLSVKTKDLDTREIYGPIVKDYNSVYDVTMERIDLVKCKDFVDKYMCETNNPSEYSALFTIEPRDAKGAIINCNSNNEWDVNNITPCLKPEYTYVGSGDTGNPEYNVNLTPKTCARKIEGAKYSTSCAINDAP